MINERQPDEFLTVDQAASIMNVTVRYVRRLTFEKRIPYSKFGKHVRIARRDLEAYMNSSRVEVD